jgi:hypothetical protein
VCDPILWTEIENAIYYHCTNEGNTYNLPLPSTSSLSLSMFPPSSPPTFKSKRKKPFFQVPAKTSQLAILAYGTAL